MQHWMRVFRLIGVLFLAVGTLWAQAGDTAAAPSPVPYASASEVNTILGQLRQTSQDIQTDLAKLKIEKWKTDPSSKQQTMANVESIRRNLQSALPEIMDQLSNSPEDMAASFRLYRNLDALYDVFGSVVEMTGAFGSKDEFQGLSIDMKGLENTRRSLGERMQNLATAKEGELARLRGQIKAMQAAPPAPPKKIIIDDTEPPAKPAKKKPSKPTTAPAGSTAKPPGAPPV